MDFRPVHLRQREPLLFAVLTVLFLVPVWWFEYVPTQDGPTHVYNAKILVDLLWREGSRFHDFLYLNARPDPTWFAASLLGGLLWILPPMIAEKLLLSVYVVSLPLGVRYAISGINAEAKFLSVLAFPFVLSSLFHLGFYSYILALAAFFFFVGYFYRHSGRWTWRSGIILSALSLLLYLLHIVALGAAYLTVGVLALAGMRADSRALGQRIIEFATKPALAFLPTLALMAFFFEQRETLFLWNEDLGMRLRYAIFPMSLVSFTLAEVTFAKILGLVFILLALYVLRKRLGKGKGLQTADAFLAVAGILAVVSFLIPEMFVLTEGSTAGGGFLRDRLNPLIWLLLFIWLATYVYAAVERKVILGFGIAVSLFLLAWHVNTYSALRPQIEEYVSAAADITPGSAVLPLNLSSGSVTPGGRRIGIKADPFANLACRIGTESDSIILQNYEAGMGYFPLRFRPEVNPEVHLGRMTPTVDSPPDVDIAGYIETTGERVDFVLVWDGPDPRGDHQLVRDLFDQLDRDYEPTDSSPDGLLKLYRFSQ